MRLVDADELKEAMQEHTDYKGYLVCDPEEIIDLAPTVERPYGEWIACSDRLPENINLVLVTWENTNPEPYYKSIKGMKFCGAGHYCNGKWFWESNTCQDYLAEYGRCEWDEMDEAIKVIAWMPLPEPYEKEGDDMSVEKSNMPEFEWVCPCCDGKEYDANSLCLECGCRMISREVKKNE